MILGSKKTEMDAIKLDYRRKMTVNKIVKAIKTRRKD
jgi:hypothetical protein